MYDHLMEQLEHLKEKAIEDMVDASLGLLKNNKKEIMNFFNAFSNNSNEEVNDYLKNSLHMSSINDLLPHTMCRDETLRMDFFKKVKASYQKKLDASRV